MASLRRPLALRWWPIRPSCVVIVRSDRRFAGAAMRLALPRRTPLASHRGPDIHTRRKSSRGSAPTAAKGPPTPHPAPRPWPLLDALPLRLTRISGCVFSPHYMPVSGATRAPPHRSGQSPGPMLRAAPWPVRSGTAPERAEPPRCGHSAGGGRVSIPPLPRLVAPFQRRPLAGYGGRSDLPFRPVHRAGVQQTRGAGARLLQIELIPRRSNSAARGPAHGQTYRAGRAASSQQRAALPFRHSGLYSESRAAKPPGAARRSASTDPSIDLCPEGSRAPVVVSPAA